MVSEIGIVVVVETQCIASLRREADSKINFKQVSGKKGFKWQVRYGL
jgi:hypothetical protein